MPTRVEPVKERPLTRGEEHSARPTSALRPRLEVRMLMTPGGIPASCASWARARADSGVSSAGWQTRTSNN